MSPRRTEFSSSWTRPLLLTGLMAVLVGCAGTGAPKHAEAPRHAASPASSHERPRVEVDGDAGFTVTEVTPVAGEVRAKYLMAMTLLQQDSLEAGIALLEEVVEQAPGVSAPLVDLGIAYRRIDADDKAEKVLEAALDLAPDHPVALNEMGIVYRRTGRFDAARKSYERALGVDPNYHFALRNLGVLCDLYLEDLPCALEQYQNYAAIAVDDEQVKIWIADIRNRLAAGQ